MKKSNVFKWLNIGALLDKFILSIGPGSLPGPSIPGGIKLKLELPTQEDLKQEFIKKSKPLAQESLNTYGEAVRNFQAGNKSESFQNFLSLKIAQCKDKTTINLHEESYNVNKLGQVLMESEGKLEEARQCKIRYINLKSKSQ